MRRQFGDALTQRPSGLGRRREKERRREDTSSGGVGAVNERIGRDGGACGADEKSIHDESEVEDSRSNRSTWRYGCHGIKGCVRDVTVRTYAFVSSS